MEGLGAAHRTSLQRQEEQQELERLRWKNTMDQKDTRLHMLEQACRDRDAEKIQRIANAVSGCCGCSGFFVGWLAADRVLTVFLFCLDCLVWFWF